MARTILIDGDICLYKAAEACSDYFEVETDENDDYIWRTIGWGSKKGSRDYLETLITKIIRDCKGDRAVICLSDMNDNFRKHINPAYKGNRKSGKPVLYKFLKDTLSGDLGYTVYEKPSLEADDIMGILATSPSLIKGDKVIWSMDKDLKTVPCKFHRGGVKGSDTSIRVSLEEADWQFMYQTLAGDSTDGYGGCKGVGAKTASKLLGEIGEHTFKEMWQTVLEAYKEAGQSEEDALMNARMARILRVEDYDFKKGEPILWTI